MKDKPPRGTIYAKNGYYYARISYYIDKKRKTKDKATGIAVDVSSKRKEEKQKRAALQKMNEFLNTFTTSSTLSASDIMEQSIPDTAKAWLEHQKGSKVPGTIAGYTYSVKDITLYFTEILPIRTVDLTSSQVETYLAWERSRRQPNYNGKYKVISRSQGGSGIENTVDHRYKALCSILQYAKREGIVSRNVASKRDCQISTPQPQRQEFPVLTRKEATELLESLNSEAQWFRVAVTLGLLIGLRRSEIIGLHISDIDWNANKLTISRTITQQTINHKNTVTVKPFTKNKRPKVFSLTKQLIDLLHMLIDENQQYEDQFGSDYDTTWDGYLFRYADGRLISPNTLTRVFGEFIDKHNFKDIRFHDLRHSCASILYANGTDLMTIQEVLGHAQLTTTISYTHKISDRKTSALVQMNDQLLPSTVVSKQEEKK